MNHLLRVNVATSAIIPPWYGRSQHTRYGDTSQPLFDCKLKKEIKGMLIIKVLKNGLGEYGVWWGVGEKATHQAYKRFFKDESKAKIWADKFKRKITKNKYV